MKKITEILYDSKIKKDKKIKEIKKILYDPKKEDYYKPIKIHNAFNDNYIEYQSNGDKDKTLSIEEYLDMIEPYLSNIINDHKEEWKIQLTVKISFISSKDCNETHTMYIRSKSSNFDRL